MLVSTPGKATGAANSAVSGPSLGTGVIHNVQALRALAALLVVFVHIDKLLAVVGMRPFGYGGVDIFFVISGFIMVHTTMHRDVTPWSFLANRIARIAPIYWTITIVVFITALAAPTLLQATKANWTELFKSLAFIPFRKSNGLIQPVLFVGWTLNYEMFFYALFAVGLSARDKKFGAAAVILGLVCLVAWGLVEQPEGVIASFYTASIMLEFALGMLICLTHRRISSHASTPLKIAAVVLLLAGVSGAVLLPLGLPKAPSLLVSGLPATLVLGCAVALERWGWAVTTPCWLLFGNASYSIYLTHPFVTQIVQKIVGHMELNALVAVALIAVTLASVCVVGVMAHYILERPLSNALRRLVAARRSPAFVPMKMRFRQTGI